VTPGFTPEAFPLTTKDGRNIVMYEKVVYCSRSGEQITLSVGAESDGASTPKELWMIAPPFGWYWRAGVLHDFLYRYTQRPKAECDALLLEAMDVLLSEESGKGFWNEVKRIEREAEARSFYEAVTLGGGCSFDEDRKAQGATK
jgi:Protein of unknown function (DUF1353)